MKRLIPVLACTVAVALSYPATAQQTLHRTVPVGEDLREFELYVPAAYDGTEDWPLIVSFHGFSEDPAFIARLDELNALADTAHVLVARPQGKVISIWLSTKSGWNVTDEMGDWDDAAFVREMVNRIDADYAVDRARIHATGYSFGSMMSYYVACKLGDVFASIGGVAGPMPEQFFTLGCPTTRPLPTLLIHGTDDYFSPWEGTPRNDYAPRAVLDTPSWWARHNDCSTDSLVTELPDLDPDDGSTVRFMEYPDCEADADVELYWIQDGGHTWPGRDGQTSPLSGGTNFDIDATPIIWEFFRRHPYPAAEDVRLIRHNVDVSSIAQDLEGRLVGVVGSQPPLSWTTPIRLHPEVAPNVYGGILALPASSPRVVDYQYVHYLPDGTDLVVESVTRGMSLAYPDSDFEGIPRFWSNAGLRAPDPPVPTAPAESEFTLSSLQFEWTPGTMGGIYGFELDTSTEFVDPIVAQGGLWAQSLGPVELQPYRTYYWRVRAENEAGESEWAIASFVTLGETVLLLEPEEGARIDVLQTPEVVLRWSPYPGSYSYTVEWSADPSFPADRTQSTVARRQSELTLVYGEDFSDASPLYWRVAPLGQPFSDVRSLAVAVAAEPSDALPTTFALHPNYPNPFNPSTTIRFDVPATSDVTLAVYDALGRRVAMLVDGLRAAGRHEVRFEADGLGSGIYLCVLQSGSSTRTQPMILLR